MKTWIRPAAAVLAAALAAGCSRGGDGEGKAGDAAGPSAAARQDSAREAQQALRDSGVSVDTQKIDTGTPNGAPHADENCLPSSRCDRTRPRRASASGADVCVATKRCIGAGVAGRGA